MKWVEEKQAADLRIIVGRDINSQLGMHSADKRDLVVSRHSSSKYAVAFGPAAKVDNEKRTAFMEFCVH
eukprot:6777671-Pyramimonas_sp.AAC.1